MGKYNYKILHLPTGLISYSLDSINIITDDTWWLAVRDCCACAQCPTKAELGIEVINGCEGCPWDYSKFQLHEFYEATLLSQSGEENVRN